MQPGALFMRSMCRSWSFQRHAGAQDATSMAPGMAPGLLPFKYNFHTGTHLNTHRQLLMTQIRPSPLLSTASSDNQNTDLLCHLTQAEKINPMLLKKLKAILHKTRQITSLLTPEPLHTFTQTSCLFTHRAIFEDARLRHIAGLQNLHLRQLTLHCLTENTIPADKQIKFYFRFHTAASLTPNPCQLRQQPGALFMRSMCRSWSFQRHAGAEDATSMAPGRLYKFNLSFSSILKPHLQQEPPLPPPATPTTHPSVSCYFSYILMKSLAACPDGGFLSSFGSW